MQAYNSTECHKIIKPFPFDLVFFRRARLTGNDKAEFLKTSVQTEPNNHYGYECNTQQIDENGE